MNLHRALIYAGSHARPMAVLGGAAMFVATTLTTIAIACNFVLDREVAKQQSAVLAAQSVTTDGSALLQRLVTRNNTSCTPENLRQLRALLFEYRFVRDIGLYDANGRIYCTTGLGKLATPLPTAA